jgi:hypothetical protein
MNDDLAKRLGHCKTIAEKHAHVNRALSASELFLRRPGALPQASINIAPLALNRYARCPYQIFLVIHKGTSIERPEHCHHYTHDQNPEKGDAP